MTVLTFWIPWEAMCSDNRKFVSGSFILTKEYRASKELIGALSAAAARKQKWTKQEGPLAFQAVVREPDRRRRDLNFQKAALDGITHGETVWWDDSQVRWSLWYFDESEPPSKATAGAEITIRVLDGFKNLPNIAGDAQPPMGRPRELPRPPAERLQREGGVRGGAPAALEPVGATARGAKRRRQPARPPAQRGPGRAVTGGEGAPEAQAGPVRPQAKAPRAARHLNVETPR